MACEIRNYKQILSDDGVTELRRDPANTTIFAQDYDASVISAWMRTDEAHGWAYFGYRGVIVFSHAPTAVAFKLRFG